MRCPQCTCLEDKVVDSRGVKDGAAVRRRRECLECGHRYTTFEEIIQAELKVVKVNSNDAREDFDRDKLRRGIQKACWKRPVSMEDIEQLVRRIVAGLERDFEREVNSSEIGNRVMAGLRDLDEVAYVRFASVYRQFQHIDEFVREIKNLEEDNA